jgi:plastocyanin
MTFGSVLTARSRLVPVAVAAAVLTAAGTSPAAADGIVSGTVKVDGQAPKLKPLAILKDGAVCGKEVPNEAVVVGAEGGLKNVVVSIKVKGPARGAPAAPTPNAFVDQVGCRYLPHVQAVTVGTKLALLNNDAVFHNVHANLLEGNRGVTVFNLAMPFKGQKLPATIKRPGVMKVRCDAGHTWMAAYVLAFDHALFAVTDDQGRFTIKGVPPGEHSLDLWHEPIDGQGPGKTQTLTIRVDDGQTATVEAKMKL